MKSTSAAIILMLLGFLMACHREQEPVIVSVVLPGTKGAAFHPVISRIIAFTASKPMTASGRPIIVQEVYPRPDTFAQFVSQNPSSDIIIADSPQQLAAIPSVNQHNRKTMNVCGKDANCPAVIAPWVKPDKQEAVQRVFRAITGG